MPLGDLRQLQAVRRHASAELLQEADVEATLAVYREWVAAGRRGAVSHEEVMAELLREVCGSSGLRRRGLRRGASWKIRTGTARSVWR